MYAMTANKVAQRTAPMIALRLWVILCMLLNALQQPGAVLATDDVANIAPYELEAIINQLLNPSPQYQMHAAALRNQLNQILRDRQLAIGEEQSLGDYDYLEEDKRSVAALAAQGLLRQGLKRSVATLAKNGQLPTPEPDEGIDASGNDDKRNVGALARGGGLLAYGKRNVGTLARDFQLPQNGKRNLAAMARQRLLTGASNTPKRNVAAVARYNSNRMAGNSGSSGNTIDSSAESIAEKRNLGALKGSPVHGAGMQQKREDEEFYMPSAAYANDDASAASDYFSVAPKSYWWYPSYASYADFDWSDRRAQKRFLDTSRDPELFGIENGAASASALDGELPELWQLDETPRGSISMENEEETKEEEMARLDANDAAQPPQQKRHIGAVYRSGFLPSYRALRSTSSFLGGGGGGGYAGAANSRFSRSGRARQLVEYYPQHERLRQPIAAVCKRCFLPNRPMAGWSGGGAAAGIRGRYPMYITQPRQEQQQLDEHDMNGSSGGSGSGSGSNSSLRTNSLPGGRRPHGYAATVRSGAAHTWGTPPRITALHRRSFRRTDSMENYLN